MRINLMNNLKKAIGVILLSHAHISTASVLIPSFVPSGGPVGVCQYFFPGTPPVVLPGGTVPCDSACSGAAFDLMSQNVSQGMKDVGKQKDDAVEALKDAAQELTTGWQVNISNGITKSSTDYLTALDAGTKRIEMAFNMSTKTLIEKGNQIAISVTKVIKDRQLAKSISKTNKNFEGLTQPVMGDVGVEISSMLIKMRVEEEQIVNAAAKQFYDFLNNEGVVRSSAGLDINDAKMNSDFDDLTDIKLSDLVSSQVIEDGNLPKYLKILQMVSINHPSDESIDDPIYELKRKAYINNATIAYHALIQGLGIQIPTLDTTWPKQYLDPVVNINNKVSRLSLLNSEVDSILTDGSWWGSVSGSREVGVIRSKIYLESVANKINSLRFDYGDLTNTLNAISSIERLNRKREQL
jgi:hypothetical protein